MKVFIFGAGASKGSQDGYTPFVKAPLVNDLFDTGYDDSYARFAREVGLQESDLAKYQASFAGVGSLEDWLTQLWEDYDTKAFNFSKLRNRTMFGRITFYIWWVMQNVSNTYSDQNGYRLFLEELDKEDGEYGFINFNYDTLLDRALVESGFNLTGNLTNYSDQNYIKPHGSVNWFLKMRETDTAPADGEQSYDILSRIRIAAGMMYRPDPIPFNLEVIEPGHSDLSSIKIIASMKFGFKYAYPFILIPLATKLYGHFDKLKENIVDRAQKLCGEADEIYLIGYRASDEIIKDIFSHVKNGTVLHIVGRSDSKKIQDNVIQWKPEFTAGKIYDKGFTDFINNYLK